MQNFDTKRFLSLIGNDEKLAQELIQLFLTDGPQLLSDLEDAQKKGDSYSIDKLAHRLKGGLKMFFAQEAMDLAEELEALARQNRLESSLLVLNKLKVSVEQVILEIQKLNRELNSDV